MEDENLLVEAIKKHYTQSLSSRNITLVCNWKAWLAAQPAPDNHVTVLASMGSFYSSWSGACKTTVQYNYYIPIILFTRCSLQGPPGQAAAEAFNEAVVLGRLLL